MIEKFLLWKTSLHSQDSLFWIGVSSHLSFSRIPKDNSEVVCHIPRPFFFEFSNSNLHLSTSDIISFESRLVHVIGLSILFPLAVSLLTRSQFHSFSLFYQSYDKFNKPLLVWKFRKFYFIPGLKWHYVDNVLRSVFRKYCLLVWRLTPTKRYTNNGNQILKSEKKMKSCFCNSLITILTHTLSRMNMNNCKCIVL